MLVGLRLDFQLVLKPLLGLGVNCFHWVLNVEVSFVFYWHLVFALVVQPDGVLGE